MEMECITQHMHSVLTEEDGRRAEENHIDEEKRKEERQKRP